MEQEGRKPERSVVFWLLVVFLVGVALLVAVQ